MDKKEASDPGLCRNFIKSLLMLGRSRVCLFDMYFYPKWLIVEEMKWCMVPCSKDQGHKSGCLTMPEFELLTFWFMAQSLTHWATVSMDPLSDHDLGFAFPRCPWFSACQAHTFTNIAFTACFYQDLHMSTPRASWKAWCVLGDRHFFPSECPTHLTGRGFKGRGLKRSRPSPITSVVYK